MVQPVGNMFEWHFTFLGAKDSPFEGGLYHGSITLPPDYPQSGPSVRLLNTNQRFKVRQRKILIFRPADLESSPVVCGGCVWALREYVRNR